MAARARVSLLLIGAALTLASSARAYCQGTTCDSANCTVDDDGCKTTGKPVAWKNGVIGMSLQRDGTAEIDIDDVRAVLTAALETWSDVSCDDGTASISFVALHDAICNRPEQNADGPNANVVMFTDKQRASTNKVHGAIDANTLGLTTRTYDANTGEIVGADIQINTADADFAIDGSVDKYDLQSVLTHELGHVIGLDHWPDQTVVMYGEFDVGETRQTLSADEIEAACAMYPPDRKTTGSGAGAPPGGFSSFCATTTVPAADTESGSSCNVRERSSDSRVSWAFLGLFGLFVRRRFRR